jgi:hypothetical protein
MPRIHQRSQEEIKKVAEECRRLQKKHNLTLTALALRKGASVTSIKRWIETK